MTSYSSNSAVQIEVYGAVNSELDSITAGARDTATSIINSKLNRITDIDAPSDAVNRCCKLLAAGIISSSPEDRENNIYWKNGMTLLELLMGDNSDDSEWNISRTVPRVGDHYNTSHDPTIPYW